MANQQASSKRAQGGEKPAQAKTAQGNTPRAGSPSRTSKGGTVERDETYGLISVLYHALQGAETYTQYIEDAQRANDEELRDFFEECRTEENERAQRARRLLASRLEDDADDDDEDDDEDEDDDDEDEEDDDVS